MKRSGLFAWIVLGMCIVGWDQGDDLAASTQKTLARLRQSVGPSVVAISVERENDPARTPVPAHLRTLADYYRRPSAVATGTILEKDGFILTSHFNMLGDLKSITVITADGKRYPAKMLGYHAPMDVALLKIEATDMPVLSPGKTGDLKQGDWVAHLGRGPEPETATITIGIVSATGRHRNTAVQTDAEMNYGSVGGPLVDLEGRLLAITSHIDHRSPWGQSSGVGFATKIEEIQKILPALKKGERTEKPKEPYLGIVYGEGEEIEGLRIVEVVPNSPAAEAGLKEGDILMEFAGTAILTPDDLKNTLAKKKIGDEVVLKIKRPLDNDKFKEETITLKLGEKP